MQGRNTVVRKNEPPRYKASGIKETPRRADHRWRRRGIMLLVALSALLFEPPRVTQDDYSNPAHAEGEEKTSGQKKDTKQIITPNTPLSDEQLKVLKTLEKRRDELENREKDLQRREERLKVAEKSLDTKYTELKTVRDEITRLFEEEKKARDDRLKMMVNTIFINMKPEQAAGVLAKMDTEVVLRMMSLVPEKQLSRVMEKMDKDRAATLSSEFMNYRLKMPKVPQ